MFDRQPMWNDGPGSDIEEQDNKEVLRRVINFLAERPSAPPVEPPTQETPNENTTSALPATLLLLDDE